MTKIRCLRCGSRRIWKDGLRNFDDGSKVQRFFCRDCSFRFSEEPDFFQRYREGKLGRERKKLVKMQPLEKLVAGATNELKGKVFEYLLYLKKKGLKVLMPDELYSFHHRPETDWNIRNSVKLAANEVRNGLVDAHAFKFILYYPFWTLLWAAQNLSLIKKQTNLP